MSQPQDDLKPFHEFEKDTHHRLAESYHDCFSIVSNRAIEPLLDAAHVKAGTRLLDVATGPGMLAAKAAERDATVIGLDVAPAMVAVARKLYPALEFRVGAAENLPFAASSFEAVISAFGIGHFSMPEHVLTEFARVLVPMGFAALSWWEEFSQNRITGVFFDVVKDLSVSTAALPPGPPVDRFFDEHRFADAMRSGGFTAIRIKGISFKHTLSNVDELWNVALGSFARVSTIIRTQTDDVQQQIRKEVERAVKPYLTPRGLEVPVAFRVVSGQKGPE
jgi:ubiquinone/menaquinone biosynthesis C-methylase UbiE